MIGITNRLELIAPKSDSSRSKVARIAADIAARDLAIANVAYLDSNDLPGMLDHVVQMYGTWYIGEGLNFELGLTGSKLQAVACSVASAAFKVSSMLVHKTKEL